MQVFFCRLLFFFFLCQLHELRVAGDDVAVALAAVGHHAARAILHAVLRVAEVPLALLPQGVKGAIAEQAVEVLGMLRLMAGKEFAFLVLEEGVVALLGLLIKCFAVGHGV